jgi:ribokinase
LVSTARGLATLIEAEVQLDALVGSSRDPGERFSAGDLAPAPRHLIRTAGAGGGEWEIPGGGSGRWEGTELPGPISDAYGCGDSFAAGLTYGLGKGLHVQQATELGARCGAACFTGRGPYEGQLRS